jgi:Helix-turn-helix of DDE superfamily endonuclease/DDE superfamily endonuclease
MLAYARVRRNRREFLALTGLTVAEFRLLSDGFARAYTRRHPPARTAAGGPRRRRAGAGRKPVLVGPDQRLLFILVYLKTYPLQVLMGELFGLSQPAVNRWVHRLLPVLRDALDGLGARPERTPGRFRRDPGPAEGDGPRLIIDGTERRRQRPKRPAEQALHYSGKRKAHTDKNVVVTSGRRRPRVGFLSRTYPGTAHDKGIADHEAIAYPPGAVLYKDGGFQGYEPAVAATHQPKKSRPGDNSPRPRSGRTGGWPASGSRWNTASPA